MTASDTLASLLIDHPFPDDEPLLHGPNASSTAGEARAAAAATATALQAAGVRPTQAVAVQLPNDPSMITAMIGVWLAGAVFVPVNPRFPGAEVAEVLAATEPAAFIDGDGVRACAGGRAYGTDDAVVLWTSGTTGAPKPIVHTHGSYLEMLDRVLGPLRAGPSRPGTPPMPNLVPVGLTLNAGIYTVMFGLRAGAAVVVMDGFDTATFAELVHRFEIRSTVLPPAAITMLTDDERLADLTPLRYVRSITAPLSRLQAGRFSERFGVLVLNGYGQAEIGEVIGWTAGDARDHPDKLGAAGRPHPGVEVRVVDEAGSPTASVGRLLVRPPSIAVSDQLADRIDSDGYLDTGDEARIDDDGFVWIEGRASEVINRGGNKVFPSHVEEVLRLAAGVRDAAVVGVPDERLGQVPVAFIVTDRDVPDDELVGLCRELLAPYKVPTAFRRVATLPRNEVGKVLRQELASRYRTE